MTEGNSFAVAVCPTSTASIIPDARNTVTEFQYEYLYGACMHLPSINQTPPAALSGSVGGRDRAPLFSSPTS
jgi:hypothetical protein